MVREQNMQKVESAENGAKFCSLRENFAAGDVSVDAKETCYYWELAIIVAHIYTISSIEETVYESFVDSTRSLVNRTTPSVEFIKKSILNDAFPRRVDKVLVELRLGSQEELFAFRDGTFGVLGHGKREYVSYSTEVKSLSGLRTMDVTCRIWYIAAIVEVIVFQSSSSVSSGKLVTLGNMGKNRLGHRDVEDRKTSTLVKGLKDRHVKYMACGSNYSTAICLKNGYKMSMY
ncbi:hypothetical protein V6N13_126879 [Hibiscus sabdariffa]